MEEIKFNYKKPERCIDLVYRELGETVCERASTIQKILWRYRFSLEQINDAIKILVEQGKVKKYNLLDDHPDTIWCRIGYDDEEEEKEKEEYY